MGVMTQGALNQDLGPGHVGCHVGPDHLDDVVALPADILLLILPPIGICCSLCTVMALVAGHSVR